MTERRRLDFLVVKIHFPFSMVGGETCGSFETVTRVSSTFELNGCFRQREEHAHENKDQDDVENFLMTRNLFSLASSDCRVGNE